MYVFIYEYIKEDKYVEIDAFFLMRFFNAFNILPVVSVWRT